MDRRAIPIIIVLIILVLAGTACEGSYSGSSPAYQTPRPPSALEMAARETAVAQETRQAMEDEARSTADALANARQATQQVINLNGTQQAQEAKATREAWEFAKTQTMEAAQATAMHEARQTAIVETSEARETYVAQEQMNATATAGWISATVQAAQDQAHAQQTAVKATANAISRRDLGEQVTQPFRAWWGWVLMIIAVPCLVWLGWKTAKVIEKRKNLWQGDPTKGEVIAIDQVRDEDGQKRPVYGLLGRVAGDRFDSRVAGLLPTPEMQEAAVMRQQTANAIQARQTAATVKARKAHKHKEPKLIAAPMQQTLSATQRRLRRRRVPGLGKVVVVKDLQGAVREGIVPPRLAETIDGQWSVVDEEDGR